MMIIIIIIIIYNIPTLVNNNKKSVTSLWIKWYGHLKCPVCKDLPAHQSFVTHTFPVLHQLRTMHYQHLRMSLIFRGGSSVRVVPQATTAYTVHE